MNEKKVSKNVYKNALIAVCIMIFFIAINFAYYGFEINSVLLILKIISITFLVSGIIFLEIAYRKDNDIFSIHAIEILVLGIHALSTAHIVELQNLDFATYILASSYIISIYYLFRAICIYTKEKRDYLKSLSDIREIVTNEPTKKVATKKGGR